MKIITAAVGYSEQFKKGFTGHLRATGYTGDITILDWTVNTLPFFTQRTKSYMLTLEGLVNNGYTGTVMTCDSRDVLFQKNPEGIQHSNLDFFLEDAGQVIGKCPYNSGWIKNGFGDDELKKLYNKTISCAGVVIGYAKEMLNLYKTMWSYMEKDPSINDQGLHNYLLYNGIIKPRVVDNEDGEVYTVHYVKYLRIKHHKIFNAKGNMPTIVHQYDRHIREL